jgi:hypothetical protein
VLKDTVTLDKGLPWGGGGEGGYAGEPALFLRTLKSPGKGPNPLTLKINTLNTPRTWSSWGETRVMLSGVLSITML